MQFIIVGLEAGNVINLAVAEEPEILNIVHKSHTLVSAFERFWRKLFNVAQFAVVKNLENPVGLVNKSCHVAPQANFNVVYNIEQLVLAHTAHQPQNVVYVDVSHSVVAKPESGAVLHNHIGQNPDVAAGVDAEIMLVGVDERHNAVANHKTACICRQQPLVALLENIKLRAHLKGEKIVGHSVGRNRRRHIVADMVGVGL